MELLPAIDILGGRVVRLAKGDYDQVTVYNDNPIEQALEFEAHGAHWLHVVDLDGAATGKPLNLPIIQAILCSTQLQVEVGGGVRTLETIDALAEAGVSRVVLGTALVADKAFASEALARYGALLTAGIDARGGEVAIQGWREGAGVPADELVAEVAQLGFNHLVYTDISRDGMRTGVDPAAYQHIAHVFGHKVIASGGVASIDDLQALGQVADSIEGIVVGRAIYEGSLDLTQATAYCQTINNE